MHELLRVYLFGYLRALDSTGPLDRPARRHTERLWSYLLLHRDRFVGRDELAEVLFPDSGRARAALRQHLHDLATHLPPTAPDRPWLLAEQDALRWNPDGDYWLDVAEFEAAWSSADALRRTLAAADVAARCLPVGSVDPATTAALERGAALYCGDLLVELGDPWVVEHREALSVRFSALLGCLCVLQAAEGRLTDATAMARAWASREPLDEAANVTLARLLARSGDQAAALCHLDAFARTLAVETGAAAPPSVSRVADEIRTGSASERPRPGGSWSPEAGAPTAATRGSGESQPEMVGAWRARLAADLLRETRLLTVAGPPGAGKSLLAGEVQRLLADRATGTLPPLDLAHARCERDLIQTVATWSGVRSGLAAGAAEAAQVIAHVASGRGSVLIVDNIDDAIAMSAGLIEALLRCAPCLRVLATCRQPLEVDGETVWRIPLLRVDAVAGAGVDGRPPGPARQVAEAVTLYLRGVSSTDRPLVPSESTLGIIAALCARLDGLPLAILAAASAFGAGAAGVPTDDALLVARIADLGVSGGYGRQTLRQTVARSTERLTPRQRELLARLAGLPQAFRMEEALATQGQGMAPGEAAEAEGTLADFERLAAISLVEVDRLAPSCSRYRMLSVIRHLAQAPPAAEATRT